MTKLIEVVRTELISFRHSFWCSNCKQQAANPEILRGTKDQSPQYPYPLPACPPCPTCGGKTKFSAFCSYPIYIRKDTGEEVLRTHKLPGAIYQEEGGWYDDKSRSHWFGPDGKCLTVICPDGTPWCIDSRASNCDRPHDGAHRCWTRDPNASITELTVGKQFGSTCGAGAGSIITSRGHWFLRNGKFEDC